MWPGAAVRVVLGMLVFGALIELAQWWTGWRFGEWADWMADAVGVLVAVGLAQWLMKMLRLRGRMDR
jgi:VanZ family protein